MLADGPSRSAAPYVVVSGDFVRTGGMDRANYALARHTARAGHETHVVAFSVAPDLAEEPNVRVHLAKRPFSTLLFGAPLLGAAGMAAAVRAGRGARIVVNGGNCPIPGALNWVHYVHAAAAATNAGFTRRQSVIARSTERIAIGQAGVVVANSERTKRDIVELLGVPHERVHVVYLGVDPGEFRPRTADERRQARAELGWDDRPRVAFVGSLGDDRKGFGVLFAAFERLARLPSWSGQLVMVGAGKLIPMWKERAQAAGLASRIDFMGFRDDVGRIVSASDLLVAPTLYEPYGLGVHEALCAETPAIVTASTGVAERYPSALEDWLLPDPRDDADLAARIDRALARPRPLPALEAFARELRGRTWDTVAADIVALAEEHLSA